MKLLTFGAFSGTFNQIAKPWTARTAGGVRYSAVSGIGDLLMEMQVWSFNSPVGSSIFFSASTTPGSGSSRNVAAIPPESFVTNSNSGTIVRGLPVLLYT